jgi:cell wall-associated NlpC family hydrolase
VKNIKSKPKEVKGNTHSLKTSGGYKSKKAAMPMSAADSLKRQYVKTKTELKKQTEEQNERPENYAVEEVEDRAERAACAASDAVRQSTQYIAGRIKQRKAQKIEIPEIPVSGNPTQESVQKQLEASRAESNVNKPKDKQLMQDRQKIKARNDAAVKAKERAAPIKTKEAVLSEKAQKNVVEQPKIKTREAVETQHARAGSDKNNPAEILRAQPVQEQLKAKARQSTRGAKDVAVPEKVPHVSEPAPKIKSKTKYLKSRAVFENKVYRLKQKKVYHSKDNLIKPKTIQAVRAKQEEKRLNEVHDKSKAAREYARDKLKHKAEFQRSEVSVEASKTDIIPTLSNTTAPEKAASSEPHITPKQKPVPEEKIKVKRTDIKTKSSYIRSHYGGRTEIKSKPAAPESPRIISQEKQLIKSKPKNVIKSVHEQTPVKPSRKMRLRKMPKARKTAKRAASKTQKQVTKQAAKQAAKRSKELVQRSAQAAKAAGRAAVRLTVKAAQAIAAAAKTVVSAIAAFGGWAVLLVVLIVIIIIAAIAASPFGIFISEEVNETGSIPLSQIISEYNIELTQEVEDVELSVEHTDAEIIDNRTDNNVVIAIFAAKTAGAEDDTAEDVVVFDEDKAEKLKEYFRTANIVEYNITETSISDGETTTVETYLTITITGKTKEELMDEYELTEKQREAVETLLEHGDVITSSSHSLAITNADVQSIIEGLPDSLPQERKDVVKNAGSLVGKVNYFWGGKSSAIGWDPAWGTMRRVTAEGSPSSGTLRAYGLDCSGFVSWVFLNSGMSGVGDGTIGQRDRSRLVSESSVQAGDLAFLPSYSHVGIVVGKDTDGNILVIHCSSSANNVVVSTAQSVGFTVFRRPNCY